MLELLYCFNYLIVYLCENMLVLKNSINLDFFCILCWIL